MEVGWNGPTTHDDDDGDGDGDGDYVVTVIMW